MEGDLYQGMDGLDDDPTRYEDQDMYDQQQDTSLAAGLPAEEYQQQDYQQDGYQQQWDDGGSGPGGAGPADEEEAGPGVAAEAGPGPGSGNLVEAYKQAMMEWRDAFKQVAALLGCAGLTSGDSGEPDVVGVLGVLRELKAAQETAQEELAGARRGLAEAQVALAGAVLEAGELRREAAAGWMAAEPAVVQVRGLLLDPAVAREFEGLRRACEERSRLVLGLKEEAEGLAFTQESKIGRALVAKCRTLQDENEELGRQLAAAQAGGSSSGGGGGADTLLSLERDHAALLRQHWSELRALAGHLEAENQDLHRALLLAERELAELKGSGGGGREGGGGGGGPRGGGGVDRGRGPRAGGPGGPPGGGRGGGYGGRGAGLPMGGRGRRGGGAGGGGGGGGAGVGGAGRYTGHKRMR